MDAHPDYDVLLADYGINAFNSASRTQTLTAFSINFMVLHLIFGIPWIQLILLLSHHTEITSVRLKIKLGAS